VKIYWECIIIANIWHGYRKCQKRKEQEQKNAKKGTKNYVRFVTQAGEVEVKRGRRILKRKILLLIQVFIDDDFLDRYPPPEPPQLDLVGWDERICERKKRVLSYS